MKFHVLVIDDDLANRQASYEELAQRIRILMPEASIQMEFITNPEELSIKIKTRHYSAALVDAVLEKNWGQEFGLQYVLRHLGDDIPIALVSSQWDSTNAAEINTAWQNPNCRMFLHWRDIEYGGTGNIRYSVAQLTKLIALRENIEVQWSLRPDDPIQILHISDLQMGGFDERRIRLEAHQSAEEIQNHCNGAPTFIAFTGDIAERGLPNEYNKARQWLAHFCQKLDFPALPTSRLLLVPGNHDVMLGLGAAGRALLLKDPGGIGLNTISECSADLSVFAYRPYLDFVQDVADCPWLERTREDQSLAWVEARYRHLGVVFFGLNTASPANPNGLPDRTANPDALEKIKTSLNATVDRSPDGPIVIGMGHHCPLSSAEEGITNPADFATFLRGKTKTAMFLHGHVHQQGVECVSRGEYRLVRSVASTLAKGAVARPENTLRGFNVLELTRKDSMVTGLETRSLAWVGDSLQQVGRHDRFTREKDGMFHTAR